MDRNDILEKLNRVFCEVFDDDTLIITEQTSADDIEDWDSLAHITLIAAVENEFNTRFEIKNALHLKTVSDIISALEESVN